MNKITYVILGVLILGLGIIAGHSIWPQQTLAPVQTNAVGTTGNTAKRFSVIFSLTSQSSTSTSILNTDGTDRIILSTFHTCNTLGSSFTPVTGSGLANLIIQAATTSTAAPTLLGNSNLVMNSIVATTTPGFELVSTSSTASSEISRVWASGSYLTFNTNATNTATCEVGADALVF